MNANGVDTTASWHLDWSGSEIRQVCLTPQGQLHLAFSVVAAKNSAGIDGFLTGVTLTLTPVRSPISLDDDGRPLAIADLLGGITSGHVQIEGTQPHRQHVLIPLRCEGTSTLNLRLISGSSLEVQGRQLSIALCGLSQFRESFNC